MSIDVKKEAAAETGKLVVATPSDVMLIKTDIAITPTEERDLEQQATSLADQLLSFEGVEDQQARKQAVEQMGVEVQRLAARQSALLKQPVKRMTERSQDGGTVANALLELKINIEALDPAKFDFEPGWFSRWLGHLPFIGTPLKRYFTQYESAQTVIAAIIRSLENGRDELIRDNVTLVEDQQQMRLMTHRLQKAIKLGQLLDQKLESKVQKAANPEKQKFVQEELLFPLRQRVIDLQQQLAVHQQGVLAAEIIVRNNQELVRGVNRALNVTVTALEVGVTVAMALANQKIVLDKVESVNRATSDLIAGTAAKLKTQGAAIHKQAAGAQINLESLKAAFADIRMAMDDLSSFRVNALPQMANTVRELDKIAANAEQSIRHMEEGNRTRPTIKIDVE